jgi:hypothetical protein
VGSDALSNFVIVAIVVIVAAAVRLMGVRCGADAALFHLLRDFAIKH